MRHSVQASAQTEAQCRLPTAGGAAAALVVGLRQAGARSAPHVGSVHLAGCKCPMPVPQLVCRVLAATGRSVAAAPHISPGLRMRPLASSRYAAGEKEEKGAC